MFSKAYKIIGIFVIVLVLLGHHSLQAQAMGDVFQHEVSSTCQETECHHTTQAEICEKIEVDKTQVSTSLFTIPETTCYQIPLLVAEHISFSYFENTYERELISHQQLARSHLSL